VSQRRPAGRGVRAVRMSVTALSAALLLALAGCNGEDGADDPEGVASPAAGPGGAALAPLPGAPDLRAANLVIISVDTLRADATQMLGGPPEITPAMADFAKHGVLFTQARSQSPQTAPSHMSLFTATYPSVHGVENFAQEAQEDGSVKAIAVPLAADIPTLPEILKAAGFLCRGVTEGGNLLPSHGFGRGFEGYTYEQLGAEDQVDLGIEALAELAAPGAGRFFLFWHTYQCHAPYVPPQPYVERWAPQDYEGVLKYRIADLGNKTPKERFASMKDVFWRGKEDFGPPEARYLHGLYHGGVDYTDDELARLLAALEERGVFDSSIVVLLSDHGEAFFEHGHWQHEDCYEECLRVPLMIRFPGDFLAGTTVDVPVGLIDVMPTLLELLHVDPGALDLPGRVRHGGLSFAQPLLAGKAPEPRPIISEYYATRGGLLDQLVAIHANGMTFILDEVRGEKRGGKPWQYRYLYDLRKDPGQQLDLVPQGGPELAHFERWYQAFATKLRAAEKSSKPPPARVEATEEEQKALEELGYF
jgi:arylsulfatase A-like enzyme